MDLGSFDDFTSFTFDLVITFCLDLLFSISNQCQKPPVFLIFERKTNSDSRIISNKLYGTPKIFETFLVDCRGTKLLLLPF